ncbi:MAG: FG-GAP-like repeat-containing protein [Cyclobacteriaceae bacterium]
MVKKYLILLLLCIPSMLLAQNYTALNGPYIGTPSKIVNAGGNLLGLVNGQGIMKSTDGGLNWTASSSGITNLNLEDITIDALSGKLYALGYQQLFTSIDNGATWTLTANSGFTQSRFIRKTTSFVFIVGSNGFIYRSSNDGVSWTQVNSFSGSPRDFEVNASGYLYIATSGNGVFRSTNNGLNVDQLDGGEGLTDTSIYSLVISGANIYATSGSGPFKSTNNGDTWVSVKNNITDCCFGYESYIERDPSGNIFLFNGELIWKTNNGGGSWTSFASPTNGNGGNLRGPYFESSSTFYVGIDNKLQYKTLDGGASWIPLSNNGIITSYGTDMMITDNGRLLYTVGYPNGFYISIDDGATWDFLVNGSTNRQIAGFYKFGSTIYGHGSGIIKTVNNGSNWTEQEAGSYYFNNLASNDGVNMFSVDSYYNGTAQVWRVLKSNDSGVNWVAVDVSGMPSANCSYVPEQDDIIVSNGGNIFIRIYDYCTTGKHSIYKIAPGTGVATQVGSLPTSNNIEDIEFFNGKIFVFTNNSKLNISNDGGETWTTKTTTSSYGRLKVINDNTFFVLNSSVFVTTDGGDNWVNTNSPGATNKWNRFAMVSSANFAYISQDQNVMFRSNTPIIPPAAPSDLSAFYYDRNSVGLIFTDNSSNEDNFVIEMAVGASTEFDSIATTTRPAYYSRNQAVALAFRDKTGAALVANTTYKFRVRASGSGGKSAPSNEISVTTVQDCSATSDVPLNRSWTAATLNQSGVGVMTKLNQTVNGSNGYYTIADLPIGASVGLSPQPSEPWGVGIEENCGIASMSSIDEYLANGNGTWNSVTKEFTIPWFTHPAYPYREETTVYTLNATDPVPEDPTSMAATVFLPGTVLLNWQSGNFSIEFEVERSLTSGSGFVKIADVTFPKVAYKDTDPALIIGTEYFYRVRAKNTTGNSGYSAETSATPRSNYLFLPMDNLPGLTYFQTGGGGAWGDVDGDGINDLFLPVVQDSLGNEMPPVIFKGDGTGQFTKLVIPELANETVVTRSVKIIDINNDGLNDLFLTRSSSNDLLLTKNSDGTYTKTLFSEYTQGGLPGGNWIDYDNDGYLDLFANTSLGAGTASDKYLLHSNGDGTFTRITEGELVTDFGSTFDTQWADYDNDGDQDVIVLNRGVNASLQSNTRLYQNNGDGTFTRVLGSVFETILSYDRTASWGDYDNDGDLDIFIGSQVLSSNPQFINRLFTNNGDGTFSEAIGSVVEEGELGTFGSAWADIDNDGDIDLFAMGYNNVLYYNDGDGTFTKYTTPELFNAPYPSLQKLYGPALEDVDGDGFLDFHNGGFSNPEIPNIIYRNTTPVTAARKWIKINLTGVASNRSAFGTRVYVTTGSKTQIRELQSHSGHATQNSTTLHFGLGSAAVINEIRVVWPSGAEDIWNNVAPNQTLNYEEGGSLDKDPPVITFTEIKSFEKGSQQATYTIGVTDVESSVVSGKMFYRKIESSGAFLNTGDIPIASGQVGFTVLEDWFDDMGMEYYFTALDGLGNEGRLPATGSFHAYMKLTGSNIPSLPNLSFGGEIGNYRTFSIPYSLQNNSISTLFNSVGGQDKTKWRLLSYRSSPEAWIDFPSSIEKGKGYLVNIVDPVEITLGEATAPSHNQSNPYMMSLTAGFNLIGNPYTFSVKWADVMAANPAALIEDPLYFNGTYSVLTQLDIFQGAFVFADEAITITIPIINSSGGRQGKTSWSSRLGEQDWELPFTLTQGSIENELSAIGMHKDASIGKDKYDRVTAPRMFDYLEMNFHHSEYMGGKNFSKEIVATSDEHVWDFKIESNLEGAANLNWDNLSFGENGKELFLLDVDRQQIVDMKEVGSYTFDPKISNQFKVYFGENVRSKIKPTSVVLGSAYPNPSSGIVTIPFTLPENGSNYNVKLEVFDNLGKRVSTLVNKSLPPDFYSVEWNAIDGGLNAGLYVYKLVVSHDRGYESQTKRIVLKN